MRSSNSNGSTELDHSLEKDIEVNIHALRRTGGDVHRPENGNGKMSGDNLGALLHRMSEESTREVETLIDELHELRNKLEIDAERIQSDMVKYAELSQGVMQLTAIISVNVKKNSSGRVEPQLIGDES
jgi:nicotinate-nucleotide pyrophosphorylase